MTTTARMMPGGPVADAVFADLVPRIEELKAGGYTPGLATVLVGDDGPSARYVGMKMQKATELGCNSPHVHLPPDATTADVIAAVRELNDDPGVDAMLVQHPAPPQVDFDAVLMAVDPDKDVDGLHPTNVGRMALGIAGPISCTPAGIEALLAFYEIPVAGHEVCILGRGITIGRPLALLLSQKRPSANAAVTVVHTGVPDWPEYTRRADIVVAAAGVPGILQPEHLTAGVVVVGAGVRYEGRTLLPDVDEACNEIAGAITPHASGASGPPPSPCSSPTSWRPPSGGLPPWVRERAKRANRQQRPRPSGARVAHRAADEGGPVVSDFPPPGGSAAPPPPGSGPGPAPGWWQASDGNWYPPDQQPGYGTGFGAPAGYGYGYGAMQPVQKTNGMAIASLVCSCLTLSCGVTFVLGIIFGHIALSQIKRNGDGGRGMALAGLIIGYVCLVGAIALVLLLVFAAEELDNNGEFQFEGLIALSARIADLVAAGPTYSLEFGPPRNEEGKERLDKTLLELEPLGPSFVSVTYGAGGSTRDATERVVQHINAATSMTVMPHLTCVAHTRSQLAEIIGGYSDAGIENLLALGGDPPEDGVEYPADFAYASELIEFAKDIGDFSIGVAAFPENHPRSSDTASDRRYLAAKMRMADFAITQFFFEADDYFRMVDELAALDVHTPVLPGVFAFVNVEQARRFAGINCARLPDELQRRMDLADGTPSAVRELAVETCTALGERLLAGGAPGLHIYTLNFSRATKEIWANLGLGR